ncbi:uncharacterized protein LOC130773517 isoform X2 [Actinidia eriantha]|uniref:uncharacterized protein LOC130773517 isoform X2 n=1 Tax=Actinidia eriantha TaxID=165200 RepID=UPI002587CD24|nr:uncharacterized protein LOC130773517 isoform X2 [Actinidia eriantha]
MESTQANTKDHLHAAQTTIEIDGHDDDLPSELLDEYLGLLANGSVEHCSVDDLDDLGVVKGASARRPSFVRCDRQSTSREGINLQVGGKITRQSGPGQKKVVVRPRASIVQPNAKDHSILVPREGDEEIAEEEAVCKSCFDILKEENILKTECGCRNALIHEECAANQSRVRDNTCDSCGQEVRSFPVTLLRGLGSAQRRDTQESYKGSYMSRLTRKLK